MTGRGRGPGSGFVEALAGAYGLLPKRLRSVLMPLVVPAYGTARRLGRAASGVRKPVHWLEGKERTGGRDLSILAFSEDRALPLVVERAFREVRVRERLGQAFLADVLRSFSPYRERADLVLVHGDRAFGRGLIRRGFLSIPDWVAFGLPLEPGTPGAWTPPSNKTVRENLRRVRKHGFTSETTTDPARFERFYREMYLPFIPSRFGEAAELVGRRLMRLFFEGGVLLLVRLEDEEVAGNILLRFPRRVKSIILGLRGGDDGLKKKAALSASYHFTILWALDAGLRRVDFGECRPFLDDGLFLFKKRWGMTLEPARLQTDSFSLKVLRYGPAVRDLLAGNPFVFLDGGKLEGLVLTAFPNPPAAEDVSALADAHLVPGLDRLFLLSEAGFRDGTGAGLDPRIVLVRESPEEFFRDLPVGLGRRVGRGRRLSGGTPV